MAAAESVTQHQTPLRSSTWRLYLLSRAVVNAGNVLSAVALPILAYRLTADAALTALVATVQTLPYLVVGLPAGAIVDRMRRRRVLVVTSLLSGVAMVSVPAVFASGLGSFGYLMAVAGLVSTLFVFADAASFGIVPAMVGRAHTATATATLVSVGTVIGVVAPLVGGVAVSLLGPALVLGIDGAGYFIAALITGRLRWDGSETVADPTAGGPKVAQVRRDVAEGLRYIWSLPIVRWLTVLGVGASLAGGAVSGLLVVVGVEQLGLTADSPKIAWLFTAGAVGTFVASVALPRLQRRVGVGMISTWGYAGACVALLALSVSPALGWAVAALFFFNLALTTLIVNGIVTRQVVTPDRLQARVNTTARLIAWGGHPFGALLGGLLASSLGAAAALQVASLGLLASLVGAWVVGVPRFARLDALTEAGALRVTSEPPPDAQR